MNDVPVARAPAAAFALRRLRAEDLAAVAALHRFALPHGLFPALGPRLLAAYHRGYLASPYGVGLAAVDGDRLRGFVVGTSDEAGHWRWTARHRMPALAAAGVPALLARPRVAGRFARTRARPYARALVRRLRPAAPGAAGQPVSGPPQTGVLAHVAVDPATRGGGLGRRLVEGYAAQARAGGAQRLALLTLADADGAAAFYDRLGWRRAGELVDLDGVRHLRYEQP